MYYKFLNSQGHEQTIYLSLIKSKGDRVVVGYFTRVIKEINHSEKTVVFE